MNQARQGIRWIRDVLWTGCPARYSEELHRHDEPTVTMQGNGFPAQPLHISFDDWLFRQDEERRWEKARKAYFDRLLADPEPGGRRLDIRLPEDIHYPRWIYDLLVQPPTTPDLRHGHPRGGTP